MLNEEPHSDRDPTGAPHFKHAAKEGRHKTHLLTKTAVIGSTLQILGSSVSPAVTTNQGKFFEEDDVPVDVNGSFYRYSVEKTTKNACIPLLKNVAPLVSTQYLDFMNKCAGDD